MARPHSFARPTADGDCAYRRRRQAHVAAEVGLEPGVGHAAGSCSWRFLDGPRDLQAVESDRLDGHGGAGGPEPAAFRGLEWGGGAFYSIICFS